MAYEEKALSGEFVRSASACLAFARAQPDLLRLLPRKDIEVIVSNGTPFLFKTALATARRMREFLGLVESHVPESEKASTVDIMKYILSYASNPSGSYTEDNVYSSEFIESSVRNLLCQITEMSFKNPVENLTASDQFQLPGGYDQSARPLRQNVQMKRGDWNCPKCSFMNFARNVKCLECEEPRPKRQLTGGEWECPQCKFFNYGRNLVCLKCDCKRPGEVVANSGNSMLELGYTGNSVHKSSMDSRSAENEEKATRWFSEVSQFNNASAVSNAVDDEDFPEIMPLRKGENRFVVSARKTPLERRSVNSRNQRYLGNYEGSTSQNEHANESHDLSIRKSLDQILGHSSPASGMGDQGGASEQNAPTDISAFPRSIPSESQPPLEMNSSVPFVPLPADMFSKQNRNYQVQTGKDAVEETCDLPSSSANHQSASVTLSSDSQKSSDVDFAGKPPESQTGNYKNVEEQDEKSERWFKRVAELHNVKDLPSAISDEDFPEIMPTRRGENRFIISKKKDRSLTSPAYKRQVAMEQASSSNFVPFVPFPPGFFARKDTREPDEHLENSEIGESSPNKPDGVRERIAEDNSSETGNQAKSSGQQSPNLSGVTRVPLGEESGQNTSSSQKIRAGTESSGYSNQSIRPHVDSLQMLKNQNGQSGWTGKSLEGSAVKEPDPLDMSEEAKAERWFRRVAQIKDISELSQIPDEDFPSIMPMRKGVNRFVVSKRKTPLERRLTSPQYRRNLRTGRDDPVNKENDSS